MNLLSLEKERQELFNQIDEVCTISKATGINAKREVKIIEQRAEDNIKKLRDLL